MSQLIKLMRSAGRVTGRPAAGFAARSQETQARRIIVVAALGGIDQAAGSAAVAAGADAVEAPLDPKQSRQLDQFEKLSKTLSVPVGAVIVGDVAPDFEVKALHGRGLDYLKVEAGNVPATVFTAEDLTIVLEVKESFTDTMLKMLNFLPARAIQVDSPETVEGFTVKQLMEERVYRELIAKPLLMKVGASIKPAAAQLLAFISPNALVVPAADVAAWKTALASIKEPKEEDDEKSVISLTVPAAAAAS